MINVNVITKPFYLAATDKDVGVTTNTGEPVTASFSKAAAGGILRDSRDRTLVAFATNLGSRSITRAELRGALFGLEIAWNSGYINVTL